MAAEPLRHAACGLEPRDRGDEVAARHVVRRREGLAVGVVRALLGDGRTPDAEAFRYPDGAGWKRLDYDRSGIAMESPKIRVDRMIERHVGRH